MTSILERSSPIAGERRRSRLPITSIQRLRVGALPAAERKVLLDELYEVFQEWFSSRTREDFEAFNFPLPETRLGLFYGKRRRLAGFSSVTTRRLEVNGREQAVFTAAVMFRREYRGGAAAAYFGLTEALRFKLLEPGVPLAYMPNLTNPSAYALHARIMRRFYPSPDGSIPAPVAQLMMAAAEVRGLQVIRTDPIVIKLPVRPRNAARIRNSAALSADPAAAHFERFVRWEDGEALLGWVPLDLGNILPSLARAGAEHLRQLGKHRAERA